MTKEELLDTQVSWVPSTTSKHVTHHSLRSALAAIRNGDKKQDILRMRASVEANHDVNMLQVGRYPYMLKRRILGDKGHLSNVSSGQLLSRVLNGHMKGIFLGHLSKENNLPELAFETVRVEIMSSDTDYSPEDLPIFVADRKRPSALVEI